MSEIYETISRGGIMMIPLFITSIIGLAVVIERGLFLRRKRILNPRVLELINHIQTPEDADHIEERLPADHGPFLNIVRKSLENRKSSKETIKEIILDQGRQEARTLERGLVILETVAGIAPLMGLLGTVLGMIKVFQVVSEQGLGQTQSLSGGISEALLTTVVGLSIAIPALVAYNYFTHKVEDLVLEIEKYSSHLLQRLDTVKVSKRGKR